MEKTLAWITGARGLIGSYLCREAKSVGPEWQVLAPSRTELDLTDFPSVERVFARERPRLIVHCAAVSRSPVCQAQPALAWQINVEVTRHLRNLADDTLLVLLSTNLVFDGQKGNYLEDDPVNPLSVYAETKVEAEQIVRSHPKHLVIRTSLNFGKSSTADRAFNEEIVSSWRSGRIPQLFLDEFRCPISARETARAIWVLVQREVTGICHVAGAERLSRWEIGNSVADFYRRHASELEPPLSTESIRLTSSSLRNYTGAPRPPDVSLNCDRAVRWLGGPLPAFSYWLRQQTLASL